MRLLQFFSLAGAALAAQHVERQEKVLTKLNLTEPLNWMASDRLFPAEVIAGNHANLSEYDEDAWVARNLEWCQTFEDCTTVSTFQGDNCGSDGGRFWFAYVYRGGRSTASDFIRSEGTTNGVAYTISL